MKHSLALLVVIVLGVMPGLDASPATKVTVNVRDHGAVGDGKTLDTAAIQKAINLASSSGGGTVVLPPGTYLSSSIRLQSHVTFQVEKDATLLGSPEWTGYQKANFYALIVADGQTDVGICGEGTLDGNGVALAADTYRLAKAGVLPDAKEGHRPLIVNLRKCKNVTVRDVTMRDSAMWVQDYRECEDLLIENIKVRSNAVVNNDGIDITDCKRVVIRGCDIDAEDDGICPKSSSSTSLCEDLLIENCRVRSSCNALKFGTASLGGFKNVTVRNLEIYETYSSAIALEIVDGGIMENVNISNIKITSTNNPLFIRLGHRNVGGKAGTLRGITISDVTAEIPNRPLGTKSEYLDHWRHYPRTLLTGMIAGLPGRPVRDVKLRNITFIYGGIGDEPKPDHILLKDLTTVSEQESEYPDAFRFGTLPAWGLYIRHAENIQLENVTLKVQGTDYRAALVCDDVKSLSLDGFHVLSAGKEPVIALHDVHGADIRNSKAPQKAARFIQELRNTTGVKVQ
jgi:Glycosyl hydrolases family 28